MRVETYKELEDTLWNACGLILGAWESVGKPALITEPEKWIRWKHPTGGMPDWTVDDNVLFLNLDERDDEYAHQRNSIEKTEDGHVIRYAMRTRVWDMACTAYGPKSYDIIDRLKDGFFFPEVQRLMSPNDVFLVPLLPRCHQATEIFAGQWWERWDITLTFNEKYVSRTDLGRIDEIRLIHTTETITETQIISNR